MTKMKCINKSNRFLSLRSLKPKYKSLMKTVKIEALGFSTDVTGSTILTIFPDEISIHSKSLVEMIQENAQQLLVGGNVSISREEVLRAIHDYLSSSAHVVLEKQSSPKSATNMIEEPKRPSNAFIMYNNDHRKKMKSLFPELNNSEISKLLGATWKSIDKGVKEKYIMKAIECRNIHKQRYPHFEYNLKRNLFAQKQPSTTTTQKENWDDYFDWYFENKNTQSSSGVIYADGFGEAASSAEDINLEPFFNSNPKFLAEERLQESWEEVCDIVSHLFPEDVSKEAFIDEQLWSSLDYVTVFNENENDFMGI